MRTGSAIWNNGGDAACLRNTDGTLMDDYSYMHHSIIDKPVTIFNLEVI